MLFESAKNYVVRRTLPQLMLLLLLFTVHPAVATAKDSFIDYATVGVAFPTPSNYENVDFDYGVGGYINVGSITKIGLIELAYFDTVTPAKSDYALDIEQDRVSGSGPTKFYSRALTGCWGFMAEQSGLFTKLLLGLSYREYHIVRPDEKDSKAALGLSYGAGIGVEVTEKSYIVLEYYSIDHLISTANLGLHISF